MANEQESKCTFRKKIVLFGGSFNPPKKADREIAKALSGIFDKVIIIPCGTRKDKKTTDAESGRHRMEMSKMAFSGLEKVEFDFYDLENDIFTPTYLLQGRYERIYPDTEIWHLMGEDIIVGGRCDNSEIHRIWDRGHEIWKNLNFLVVKRPGYGAKPEDLPPNSKIIEIKGIFGSGTLIRKFVAEGGSIEGLVDPKVVEYIKKNNLYKRIIK